MEEPSKQSKNNSEGNIYDRIFKENAETLFIPLIEKELNLEIKHYQILPEKLPKTIEREVDFLYKVVLKDNSEMLLHIEFQTKTDLKMIYRMAMYHGLAFWKYQLPIKPIVVYLGEGKSKMRNKLKTEEIFDGFDLININTLNSKELINSKIPEVIMIGMLGDFEKERSEAILRLIITKLKKYSKSKSELSKYYQQLIILARLRKLDSLTEKIVDEMPITYDITTDYLFNKGTKLGRDEGIGIGRDEGINFAIQVSKLHKQGKTIEEIAIATKSTILKIKDIITKLG